MNFLTISLLLMALNAGLTLGFCPNNWSEYGAYCLRYIGYNQFQTAITTCNNLGGRLFEPRSKGASIILSTLGSSIWIGVENNRYKSTGELVDFTDGTVRSYGPGFAYVYSGGYWTTTTSSSSYLQSYCELPAVNSACLSTAKIFVENSFSAPTSDACRSSCANTRGCKFYTYSNQACGQRSYSPGYLAGGGPPNSRTGFPNYEITQSGRVLVGNAVQNVETAAECQKLCSEDPKCNSFTWTLKDYTFGGINTKLCVFNYGKTTRKLDLISYGSNVYPSYFIGSGPRCCNGETDCKIETLQTNLFIGGDSHGQQRNRRSADMPTDEELKKYQEEFEEFLRTGSWPNSNVTTTTTVGQ